MSILVSIVLASVAVSAISLIGAVLLGTHERFSKNTSVLFVSFAAGVMLASAFFDLLPEAVELSDDVHTVLLFAFFGVMTFFFLERFVVWFHHHDGGHGTSPSAILVLFGDTVHNALDGLAIAAGFLVSPALGITTTLALCAHEIPQEIADYSVLRAGGFSRNRALLFNFLSGLSALVSAVVSYFFLTSIAAVEWMLLAFSAGMFLYISTADLIPELHQEFEKSKKWRQAVPFVFGSALLWGLTKILAH